MISPAEDRLRRMLEEGKITPEQFEELRAALPEGPEFERAPNEPESVPPTPIQRDAGKLKCQPPVRVCLLASLLLFGTFVDMATNQRGIASGFSGYALQIILAIGLFFSQRWAYVLTGLLMSVNFCAILAFMVREERLVLPLFLYIGFFSLMASAFRCFFPGKRATP